VHLRKLVENPRSFVGGTVINDQHVGNTGEHSAENVRHVLLLVENW
jgi:hypothetical protein